MTMRVAYVEWPEGLLVEDPRWPALQERIAAVEPDLLLTNELPFGPWVAAGAVYSDEEARRSVTAHEHGLEALEALGVPAIVSTRPVLYGERLVNEAFVLAEGVRRPLHRKQYFPKEPGWWEREWYAGDSSGFQVAEVLGIKLGVLICTEVMFNEHARIYGRQGASLILVPRAAGADVASWQIAGAMASLVSGAYVVSSNRVGSGATGPVFGGGGFAYAPPGRVLGVTSAEDPVGVFELDPTVVARAQAEYPCYVREQG
ncbi:MAG TPA: carbon-nitrogen hydrolase family protein [Acidobacteriaceae bacterium]|jgi:N-carbamoylputrescine amidase